MTDKKNPPKADKAALVAMVESGKLDKAVVKTMQEVIVGGKFKRVFELVSGEEITI